MPWMSRRYRPRRRWPAVVLTVAAVWLVVRLWQAFHVPAPPAALEPGEYDVARVVDGDTLLLTNQARVRLLGIDAPESVKLNHPVEPWGPEAAQFVRRAIGKRPVRLRFDRERVDRYGRFLAYVWVRDPQSGQEVLLNEELLRAGLARATLQYRFAEPMKRRFRAAEEEARRARRGLWSDQLKAAAAA
jgi:micrococcal nuclease